MTQAIIPSNHALNSPATRRELAIAAWLSEKSSLSHSAETQRAYSAMIAKFRLALQQANLDLDSPYHQVSLVAQAFAGAGKPKAATYNRRLAVLSSFYDHAIKHGLIAPQNPIELVARRRTQAYRGAKALDMTHIQQALAAIDRRYLQGQRDYALLSVALITGRRVSELAKLRLADIEQAEHKAFRLTWRTKGDELHHDILPARISQALDLYLGQLYDNWPEQDPQAAVWASTSKHNRGQPISSQAIADICQKRLGISKVHRLRHTFAHNMEQHGAKLSEIQRKLGHKNIATTSLYLQVLASDENPYAEAIEQSIGIYI